MSSNIKSHCWEVRVRRAGEYEDDVALYQSNIGPVTAGHVRGSPSVKRYIGNGRWVAIRPCCDDPAGVRKSQRLANMHCGVMTRLLTSGWYSGPGAAIDQALAYLLWQHREKLPPLDENFQKAFRTTDPTDSLTDMAVWELLGYARVFDMLFRRTIGQPMLREHEDQYIRHLSHRVETCAKEFEAANEEKSVPTITDDTNEQETVPLQVPVPTASPGGPEKEAADCPGGNAGPVDSPRGA